MTGGTGFIGSRVVGLGKEIGAHLYVPTRNLHAAGDACFAADLTEDAQVVDFVRRIQPQGVIHLAGDGASHLPTSLANLLRVNVVGLNNLLTALALLVPGSPVVVAGSGAEYGPKADLSEEGDPLLPGSAYGISKAAASMLALSYSSRLAIVVLRIFNVFGPGEKEPRLLPSIVKGALAGQPVLLTHGAQLRDYSYSDDIAMSLWLSLTCAPLRCSPVINVGSGRLISIKDFANRVVDALDSAGLQVALQFGGIPYARDEQMLYAPHIEKMNRVLGWQPDTPIGEALRQSVDLYVAAWRQNQTASVQFSRAEDGRR